MSELLLQIIKLREQRDRWRRKYADMKRSRDMWKNRALRRGL